MLVTCAETKARPEETCERGRPRPPTPREGSQPCLRSVPWDGPLTVSGPTQLCGTERRGGQALNKEMCKWIHHGHRLKRKTPGLQKIRGEPACAGLTWSIYAALLASTFVQHP